MLIRNCKLGEADEIISDMFENVFVDYYEIDVPFCKDTITIYGYRIIVPDVGYSIRGGVYNNWDEDESEALPDFALSLIYDLDESDPAKYLYWEQDDELVSLHNFLTMLDKSNMFKGLTDLDCKIEFKVEENANVDE